MKARLIAMLWLWPVAAGAAEPDATAIMLRMEAAIHHGVALAAQGASLVLSASRGEEAIDRAAAEQGRLMIAQGRALVVEAAGGGSMMKLHAGELSEAESTRMIGIHGLEGAAMTYLKTLERL